MTTQTDWLETILGEYSEETWDARKAQELIKRAISLGTRAEGRKPPRDWYTQAIAPMNIAYQAKDLAQLRRNCDSYEKALLAICMKM